MSTYFETTVAGTLTDHGRTASCPTCHDRTGLTICGYLGRPGSLRCRRGHTFTFPRGWDAVGWLRNAVNDPRRTRTR